MPDLSIEVALRLTVAVWRDEEAETVSTRDDWSRLSEPVTVSEVSSTHFAAGVEPDESDAADILAQTFASHPAVNVTRRLVTGGSEITVPVPPPRAWVLAEVVVRGDIGVVEPGEPFPEAGPGTPQRGSAETVRLRRRLLAPPRCGPGIAGR
jgi:hypothetical protein